MTENKFTLLKRTFPKSKVDRECDGYKYLMEELSIEDRKNYQIDDNNIQKHIKKGEVYMYQVGVENGKFKTKCFSLHNFELIRKNIFINED
jgi:hypothetical protein